MSEAAAFPRRGGLRAVFRREFAAYFATPLAAVFLVIFVVLAGIFTFNVGGLYPRGQADLRPLFQGMPWLYLFLVPAISMRLWAEERRQGTIELLATLPLRLRDVVLGKFLAAWAFAMLALALTFPLWITVEYLGAPDRGAIVAGYLGSALMVGAFLAIGAAVSSLTKSQVVAFVLCAAVCFLFLMAGFPVVLDFLRGWAPPGIVDAISSLSFLTRFESIVRGVVDVRDVLYFGSVIVAFLLLNGLFVDWRKGS
ncbi:MAG: ABC transporter permease subunit [Phycisphaerales bacterium]